LGLSGVFTFKTGLFIPSAKYESKLDNLWWTEFDQMSFTKSNFTNTVYSISYEHFLTRQFSFSVSVDGYNRTKLGIYEEVTGFQDDLGDFYAFEFVDGAPIEHSFSVSVTPIQFSLKIAPLGRGGKFIPYVGGGAGLYIWNVKLLGEVVDFSQPELFEDLDTGELYTGYPIFVWESREENRLSIGYHALAGIMIPIARQISVELEFKYNFLKGNLEEGFEGFEPFDLGGTNFTVGINYWF
jgi:hypothetical protein